MSDYEYEEENLDDFMESAAEILSDEYNPERSTILESLKQHLSSIFHVQPEMENFFNTLNGVIFLTKEKKSKSGQRMDNRQPFILYPLVFSFNPRTTSYFLDSYLNILQQSICEENRPDFTFLSEVFANVIQSFFSDEKKNKNLIKKGFLLDANKKRNIYEKLLRFCKKNIDTNKKVEQSVGCLLLTEFIEKCPMTKEDKQLENLFKIISDYLDDRWFECKLDLLNCTISLIFAAEVKFKPYANICLFRVLDYLTDMDWMKRKLAINIVYTLVFYCKEEIMTVKENIIEFLYMLKEDSVPEVREVCLHTLKFLGEEFEIDTNEFDLDLEGENSKPKNMFNKYKNKNNIINNYTNSNRNKSNKSNKNTSQKKLNRSYDVGDKVMSKTIGSMKSNKSNKSNLNQKKKNIVTKKVEKENTEKDDNLRLKLQKEKEFLEKIEKDFMEKKKNYNTNNYNIYTSTRPNFSENNTINYSRKKTKSSEKFSQKSAPNPLEQQADSITSTINAILEELKKIQDDQNEFKQMLVSLKKTTGSNFSNLNDRIKTLEKNINNYNKNLINKNYRDNYREGKSSKDFRENKIYKPLLSLNKYEENIKIENLKNKFKEGKYNEALIESKENDKYLFKLLPLMDKTIIPQIEIAILEDAILRLNKRIRILCFEEGRERISDILVFYIQLLKSNIEIKVITQINIKDALTFLKSKANNKLNDEDLHNIKKIIGSLNLER